MNKPEINEKFFGCFGKLAKRYNKPTAIVIHHTCTSSPKRTRETLIENGYSTHFEVDVNGTIYKYANVDTVCKHCGSPNVHTIGIDVTHKKDSAFPEVQVEAVLKLVSWLCEEYGIEQEVHDSLSGIYPHRALGSTVCPQSFPMNILNNKNAQQRE